MVRWLPVVALLGTTPAVAQPELGLAWQAPAECPDVEDVRARIAKRLGAALDEAAIGVAITISRDGDAFVAQIDGPGEPRTLTSTHCDELADAAAVIVARIAGEARAPIAEVRAPAAEPVAPPEPTELVGDGHRWHAGIRLSTIGATGVVPGTGLGAELVAVAHRGDVYAELGAARWRTGVADVGNVGVDVALTVVTARLGWRFAPLRVWVVAEGGAMEGSVAGAGSAGGWLGLGAGGGGAWHLTGPLSMVAGLEGVAAVERAQLILSNRMPAYESAPVSLRISVGFELAW